MEVRKGEVTPYSVVAMRMKLIAKIVHGRGHSGKKN